MKKETFPYLLSLPATGKPGSGSQIPQRQDKTYQECYQTSGIQNEGFKFTN